MLSRVVTTRRLLDSTSLNFTALQTWEICSRSNGFRHSVEERSIKAIALAQAPWT